MIEKWKVSEVKANPNNPRIIKDDKFKKLVQSIKDFPEMLELRPIVVNNDGIVLGGNMRLKACKEAGLKEVPVIKASELTEEQQKEFIIKDNVGFGEWDWEDLANNWDAEELTDWGLDLPVSMEVELEAEEDDFDVPEDGIETDIVLGDLFEIGEHRLLCGDSTDSDAVARLMDGEKADMVFTSPPYNANTSFNSGGKNSFGGGKNLGKLYENYDDNLSENDYISFCQSVLNNCILNTNGFIFWNINYNTNSRCAFLKQLIPYLDLLNEVICWKKNALPVPSGLTRNFEFIFVLSTKEKEIRLGKKNETNHNVWDINNSGALDKKHRASFPIELPSKGIDLASEINNIVLEPFAGSGTTMVSSHQLNRKCYGIELDPKYCQVIIDRMIKIDPTLKIKRNGVDYAKG